MLRHPLLCRGRGVVTCDVDRDPKSQHRRKVVVDPMWSAAPITNEARGLLVAGHGCQAVTPVRLWRRRAQAPTRLRQVPPRACLDQIRTGWPMLNYTFDEV